MNQFILHLKNESNWIKLFKTQIPIVNIYNDLQRGAYQHELIERDGQIPVIKCHFLMGTEYTEYIQKIFEEHKFIKDLDSYHEPQPEKNDLLILDRVDLFDEDLSELENQLHKLFPDSKIYKKHGSGYVGAGDDFVNVIINVSYGLLSAGIYDLLKYLISKKDSSKKINQIHLEKYLKYLEDHYNINPIKLKLQKTEIDYFGNLSLEYYSRNKIFTLKIGADGEVIDSEEINQSQTVL